MNIGIRLHDVAQGTLQERLAVAKEQGFSCMHLAVSKTVPGFAMADSPALLEGEAGAMVEQAVNEGGVACAVLGCYMQLATADEEALQRTQAAYFAHLRFAGRIGSPVVGTETPPAKDLRFSEPVWESEDALQLLIRNLKPVVRRAEEEGAILAIEPVFRHIVSTPERAERLLDAIPSDHLRIILDAVNLLSPEGTQRADAIIEEAIRRLGDKVSVLHLKDYRLIPGEAVPESIACGTGGMRYERLLRFARERDLPMTLENTTPDNAVQTRLYLESIAAGL